MFCSECGTKLADESAFCPHCGAPVVGIGGNAGPIAKKNNDVARPVAKKKRWLPFAFVGGALAVVVAVAGLLVASGAERRPALE